ncbi:MULTISPECIES: amino acid ABC transporter permease [Anaerostipes]|uniref:Amino acid ABC transporter permease n=1 Tax=Anaerostipes butyraticus TaxID=645466 RepID=A0A916VBV2_9FIRM|nr:MULTISPECIES: amino acid ABC transporter permease [Anaerostipes]GFO84414.1 amino acid ABC transporter permease [Anaerostipes butyraticus]HJC82171.1 amino acid ABC transporter permease [Candidatus Anaerostipes avicola]
MEQLQSDIYQVFIEADRYKMFLDGLKVTIGVSIAAVLLGILLGMVLALMKMTEVRKGKKTIFSVVANIYIDIIRGTPTVVQLLIIYFLVFQTQMGMVAGIVTFGINSSAYVAEIIRAGIMAVDKGQMEAGRSLGLSYTETMRYIILPQAVKNILPALGNEFIVLIKETAILGYVAIQDLTKASDFIVSRTYIMFVPLIGCALIYYVLVKILTIGLNAFERRLRQSDIR